MSERRSVFLRADRRFCPRFFFALRGRSGQIRIFRIQKSGVETPLFLFKSRQNEIFEPEGPQTLPPGDAGRSTMLLSWIDDCATHQPEAQVSPEEHAPPLEVEPTVRQLPFVPLISVTQC